MSYLVLNDCHDSLFSVGLMLKAGGFEALVEPEATSARWPVFLLPWVSSCRPGLGVVREEEEEETEGLGPRGQRQAG